jgi:hypothetical protein
MDKFVQLIIVILITFYIYLHSDLTLQRPVTKKVRVETVSVLRTFSPGANLCRSTGSLRFVMIFLILA